MVSPEKFPHPSELKKHHLWEIENCFPQCADMPDFIYAFKQRVMGLSKEVCNSLLAKMAYNLRRVKVGSSKKSSEKRHFYFINPIYLEDFLGLPTLTLRRF